MKKNIIYSILLIIIILTSSFVIIADNIKAQPPTIVKGYVYIDGVVTKPQEVHLTFESQSRKGTVYDDGRYIVVLTGEEVGSVGVFKVIYNSKSYTPPETVTIEEDEYQYNIDLHVTTSGAQPDDPTNIQPKADACGPYYAVVNEQIYFDGSGSSDPDGSIANYEWDFGDGGEGLGVSLEHTYTKIGVYPVILTVTDNKGKSDLDITYAYISETLNYPPEKPVLIPGVFGSFSDLKPTRINRIYLITSTDPDNDSIRYIFDWGDETFNVSEFVPNGTSYETPHIWKSAGIFVIKAYAEDEKHFMSEATELEVLVDAMYCGKIGYMVDYTNDTLYDLFHSNDTGEETIVKYTSGRYLIDENNDGVYDYEFDAQTNTLSVYSGIEPEPEDSESFYEKFEPLIKNIILVIAVILVIIIVFLIYKILKKDKKKKVRKEKIKKPKEELKEEKQEKEDEEEISKIPEEKKDKAKSVEDDVDRLLSKRK